jgi:hypothetical protein
MTLRAKLSVVKDLVLIAASLILGGLALKLMPRDR